MIRYNRNTKSLRAFQPVRVLTGRDLYRRYGQRVPVDTEDFVGFSRNPLERMEQAMRNAHISAEEHIRLMNELEQQNEPPQQTEEEPEDSSSE